MSEKIRKFLVEEGQVGRKAVGLKAKDIKRELKLETSTSKIGEFLAKQNWCGVIERWTANRYYVKKEKGRHRNSKDRGR